MKVIKTVLFILIILMILLAGFAIFKLVFTPNEPIIPENKSEEQIASDAPEQGAVDNDSALPNSLATPVPEEVISESPYVETPKKTEEETQQQQPTPTPFVDQPTEVVVIEDEGDIEILIPEDQDSEGF